MIFKRKSNVTGLASPSVTIARRTRNLLPDRECLRFRYPTPRNIQEYEFVTPDVNSGRQCKELADPWLIRTQTPLQTVPVFSNVVPDTSDNAASGPGRVYKRAGSHQRRLANAPVSAAHARQTATPVHPT